MTTVGVVVPAHNPGPLLRRALDSVVAQTLTEWRAVVVDDGSTEDLRWVASLDPRITLLQQENAGVSRARNAGVAALETQLIAFLDQDDEWHPDKLSLQIEAVASNPDAAFCHTEFTWVFADRTIAGTYAEPVTYVGLLTYQHVLLSSVVVRRDRYQAIGGHDPTLAMVQDYDLYLRLTMDGSVPVCVHKALVDYHVHGDNASRDYRLAHEEGLRVIRTQLERVRRSSDPSAVRAARDGIRQTHRLYADQALQRYRQTPRRLGGVRHLARAFRWDPTGIGRQVFAAARRHTRLTDRE